MALICDCGQYLGTKSVCPKCGRGADPSTPSGPMPSAGRSWGDPLPPLDSPSFADDPHDSRVETPPVPATWGELRGTIAEGEPVRIGAAGGIALVRLFVLVLVLGGLIWKSDVIILAITNSVLSLVLTYLVPIILIAVLLSFVSKAIPLTGCLGQFLRMFTFSALTRRPRSSDEPNGWRITVENSRGATTAELAAPLRLDGGEEVSLHGPALGGVKHAWLIQVLSPRPTTRLARGVLPALIATVVGIPLFLLLAYFL